ncbi:CocE/NonD family hydrolase [Antarctobacter sp.]|uniref:CocE/NonD family hydrolase n=1 Tax=Antarctobacter sp. TaxID=1872577 RepID=UPI003A93E6CF
MLEKTETRNGLVVDWNVVIPARDGLELRADVYRPVEEGVYPVILSYGPYAKGLPFQVGYPDAWGNLVKDNPEVQEGSSCDFANWETVDPEKWVPKGYVCVRVDSRGAGMTPGKIDYMSRHEQEDFYDCIEWAGVQPWSNGKVGLAGISYFAANQWLVAGMRPPHLAAICPFEGWSDYYRETCRNGGIMGTWMTYWAPPQIHAVQYGRGSRAEKNPNTGESVAGDVDLDEDVLAANRIDIRQAILEHPLDDAYYAERRPDLANIEVPLLSCGNWGGQGLHLRGNTEGYLAAGSRQKWLELHGYRHWTEFYTAYGTDLQMQFFDHFLKGIDNGWAERPPVLLKVRHIDGFVERSETEWPIARTDWMRFYLDAEKMSLSTEKPGASATLSFAALDETLTFRSAPLEQQTEITGPLAARLAVSSSTEDADIFVSFRVFAPDGSELLFPGANDPRAPMTLGWLRASHRKLDPEKSLPYRPYHSHDEEQLLTPGEVYGLDVELWPTSIVVPAGYTLAVTIGGTDYDHGLETTTSILGLRDSGVAPMVHDDPTDRAVDRFGGTTTLHWETGEANSILLPVIPTRAS